MFKAWPKIPRLNNERYHISEKLDGTNACIIITKETPNFTTYSYRDNEYTVYAQSRKCLIKPEKDNYGFAKWVQNNAKTLIQDLGEGYHYGEWWGQGIQRTYGLSEKRFSLFNPTKQSSICHNVPIVLQTDIMPDHDDLLHMLKTNGSFAVPGYTNPEGLVIYAEKAKTYWKVILNK